MVPVAGSRRPKTVSCLGLSRIGSAPSISIRKTVPCANISVPAEATISWSVSTPGPVLPPKLLVLKGESPIKLAPQFSQNTTPGRFRNEQFGQTCISSPLHETNRVLVNHNVKLQPENNGYIKPMCACIKVSLYPSLSKSGNCANRAGEANFRLVALSP